MNSTIQWLYYILIYVHFIRQSSHKGNEIMDQKYYVGLSLLMWKHAIAHRMIIFAIKARNARNNPINSLH